MDPYKLLGIERDASDDEIKKAYRQKSRMYHPDMNINNPNKEEAEVKFKEVQQAYQQIMKEKEYEANYGSNFENASDYSYQDFGGFAGSQTQKNQSETDIHMLAAANYIRSGHYNEALNVLNGISQKSALWYFYSASANLGIGNNIVALNHAQRAVELEPDNMQYSFFLSRLQGGGNWYQDRQTTYGYPSMSGNGMCFKLCMTQLLCSMCCGGSGMCCGGSPRYM